QLLGILVFIGLVYFLGSTLDSKASAVVGDPQSFVAFVLSGIAFTDLLMQGLYSLPHAIRDNQKSGTLEPMLLTPISPIGLAFASSLFNFALAGGRLLAYLIFGFVVLGYWHNANPLSLLLVLIPAAISFVALGALSAAFIVLL